MEIEIFSFLFFFFHYFFLFLTFFFLLVGFKRLLNRNHEYYMGSVPEIDSIMKNMCSQFPNVKYLQKEAFSVALSSTSQLVVLGCTLWSEMNPKQLALVKTRLNDYNHIAEFKADANYAVKLHQDQVSWLRAALNETIKLKSQKSTFVVVATHHGPLLHGTSEAYYDNSPINCAFASVSFYLKKKIVIVKKLNFQK